MNRKKIIHLDDHEIFSTGLKQGCLNKLNFPFLYLHFTDSDNCLQYINNSILLGAPIDLLITDFNHPGLHGYEFALEVRRLCQEAFEYIPILLISMAGLDKEGILKGIEEHLFDKYLPKSSSSEEIQCSILELCQYKS